jgi:hypothetical protein
MICGALTLLLGNGLGSVVTGKATSGVYMDPKVFPMRLAIQALGTGPTRDLIKAVIFTYSGELGLIKPEGFPN